MQKACLSQRTGWLHYKSQELITSTAVMISPRHKLKPVWFGLMESSHPLSLSLFPAGCVSNLPGGNVWDGSVPILWPQTRVLSEHDLWCSHKLTVWVQSWLLMYSKALWRCAGCINYLRWGSQTECWMLMEVDFNSLRAARTLLMLWMPKIPP